MKIIVSVALLSAFAVTPALADNTNKYYVASDLGAAIYNNVTVNAGTYPNPWMLRIAGGYHFGPMLAAEVGYAMFGDSTLTCSCGTSATISASSIQIAAIGTFPMNPEFDWITKIGLAYNSHKLDVKDFGTSVISSNSSQTDLLFGIGAQLHVNSQVTLRAQAISFGEFGNFGNTGKPMAATAFSIGVAYDF